MSELAFNYQGERFIPPGEAAHWRVRRIRDNQRGQLDVVRDVDGVPLIVPIDISHDEFRAAVGDQDGRYRLDALNAEKMHLEAPAAYVTVPVPRRSVAPVPRAEPVEAPAPSAMVTAPFGTWPALPMPSTMTGTEYLLAEALRGQVAMFQTLAVALSDRMASNANGASQMIGAAAELVRAADGAAMPRRRPEPTVAPLSLPAPVVISQPEPRNAARYVPEPDDDDDDDGHPSTPAPPTDEMDGMIEKLGKVMNAVGPAVPHLVALVRGYPPTDVGLRNAPSAEQEPAEPVEECEPEPAPAVTHAMASHMILVHQELGEDGPLFRKVLQRMEPEERHMLVAHLCSMTLDDAVDAAATRLAAIKMRLTRRARAQRAQRERSVPHETPIAAHEERHAEGDGHDIDPTHQEQPADGDHNDSNPSDDPANPEHDDDSNSDDSNDGNSSDGSDDSDDSDDSNQDEATHDAMPSANPDDNATPDHVSPEDNVTQHDLALMPTAPATQSPPRASATTAPPTTPTVAPSLDAHMMQIARHLKLTEVLQARAMIGTVSAAERATWIQRLMALPPVEAAKVVRAELARRAGR